MCTFTLAPIIGHVGDGNFHSLIMIDPNNEHELAAAKELAHRMAQYVQQQYNFYIYNYFLDVLWQWVGLVQGSMELGMARGHCLRKKLEQLA